MNADLSDQIFDKVSLTPAARKGLEQIKADLGSHPNTPPLSDEQGVNFAIVFTIMMFVTNERTPIQDNDFWDAVRVASGVTKADPADVEDGLS